MGPFESTIPPMSPTPWTPLSRYQTQVYPRPYQIKGNNTDTGTENPSEKKEQKEHSLLELRDVTDMLYGVIQAKLCNTCSSPITLQGNNQTFTLERSRSLGNQKSGHKRRRNNASSFLPIQTFDIPYF